MTPTEPTHDLPGTTAGNDTSDNDTSETFTEPVADRPATPDEERAAERAAADVDLDSVGEHYRDAARTGAEVRGEGEIEPG